MEFLDITPIMPCRCIPITQMNWKRTLNLCTMIIHQESIVWKRYDILLLFLFYLLPLFFQSIENNLKSEYAVVCMPEYKSVWTNTEFLMRNIVNPVTHLMAMICLLFVAIVYFVMPTLRDLVGNIVTTIALCLIVSQAADLIRLLTIFTNHVSLIITGICKKIGNHIFE